MPGRLEEKGCGCLFSVVWEEQARWLRNFPTSRTKTSDPATATTQKCACVLAKQKKKKHNAKKKNGRKVRWFEFVAGQPFSEGNFDLCPKVILITFQKWKELVQLKTQQIEEIGLKAGVVKNKKKKRKPQTNQREEEQRKERKEQEEATRDGRETKGEIGRICWAACRRQS